MAVERVFAERQRTVAVVLLVMVALEAIAGVVYLAVYDFDVGAIARDPGALPARGAAVATVFRLGLLTDMLGYLALAPATIYLHGRLKAVAPGRGAPPWLVDLLTLGALGWSLVGSLAAALFAAVGPTLLEASSADAETGAARVVFAAVANAVNVGWWGTLEWLLLGPWLIGVGWFLRVEGRGFAWLAGVAGAGVLVYAFRTGLSGRQPVDLTSPIDLVTFGALSLFLMWAVWLAVRLWRGR